MPNWIHQHQFAFQYGYGSVVLLIFATLLFLYELLPLPRKEPLAESWEMGAGDKPGKKRQLEKMNGILSLALIFSIIFSLSYLLLPRIVSTDRAVEDVRLANDAREVLVEVPCDKEFWPHLTLLLQWEISQVSMLWNTITIWRSILLWIFWSWTNSEQMKKSAISFVNTGKPNMWRARFQAIKCWFWKHLRRPLSLVTSRLHKNG